MPVLTSGSSTTVTLGDYDSITLQNRPGQQASITVAGTLVNGAHTGARTYGPYNSGTSVSITATVGDLYYEVADGVAPSTPGSGSGSVAVQDEGTQVAAAAARLNFRGAGVTASSDGAGGVNVDIPGGGSSGGIVSVTADLTINAANAATYNGKTLSITSNVTITIAAGVAAAAPGFGFLVGALPATGGVNFIGSGGATINGLTTSVARTEAANPSGVSLYQSSTGDVYKLTGY